MNAVHNAVVVLEYKDFHGCMNNNITRARAYRVESIVNRNFQKYISLENMKLQLITAVVPSYFIYDFIGVHDFIRR